MNMNAGQHLRYGAWTSSRIGGGGYLLNTVFSPSAPNVIYCNSDVGGIFKSTDGGKSWKMIHGTVHPAFYFVRGIDVDPRDSDIVLAATGEKWGGAQGIYRTVDGGKSWKFVCRSKHYGNSDLRNAGSVFARDPQQPDTVYAAAGDGIFLSRDNGATWRNLGMGGYGPCDLKMDRSDSSRLWFCAQPLRMTGGEPDLDGGFFVTEDGGENWTGLADSGPLELLQAPWDPSLLYAIFDYRYPAVSEDGGKSWRKWTDGLEPPVARKRPRAQDDDFYAAMGAGPDFILLGSGEGTVYRLNRDETAWKKVTGNIHLGNWFLSPGYTGGYRHFGRAMSSISIDPGNPEHWLITDWFAIHQTGDAGKNWFPAVNGVEMTVIHCVVPNPAVSGRIYVGMADNRLLMSADNGRTFFSTRNSKGNIKSIAVSRQKPACIYAVGPRNWEWQANTLYMSTRPETDWTMLPAAGIPGLDENCIASLAVSPVDADELYAGRSGEIAPGRGGVYKSTDGGRNFIWFGEGMERRERFFHHSIWNSGPELAISGDGRHLVAVSQRYPDIYIRETGENQWSKTVLPAAGSHYAVTADPLAGKRFYLASRDSGACRSDDGGRSWTHIYSGDVCDIACDPRTKDRIAIALNREEKILVSDDAGESWRELDNAIPNRKGLKLCFSGDILLAGTDGNGVFYTDLSKHPGNGRIAPRGSGLLQPDRWKSFGCGRDGNTAEFRDNADRLEFVSPDGFSGTLSQHIPGFFRGKTLTVKADADVRGDPVGEFALALQFFDGSGKQNGFRYFVRKRESFAMPLSGSVKVPESAESVVFVIVAGGEMRIILDHLSLEAQP